MEWPKYSLLLLLTQKSEDDLFLVATVATGVYPYRGKLALLAPALDGERGDAQKLGHFFDRHEIG